MAALLRRIIASHSQKQVVKISPFDLALNHFYPRNMVVRLVNSNQIKNQLNSENTAVTGAAAAAASGQTLNLSDTCVKQLEAICKDGAFLRVTVEGGGCSGFQYKFELDTKLSEDDLSFGTDTAKIVTDSISLDYCNGATIDYHSELIRSGFRVLANPKAEQGCSCGASFALKLD